MAQTLKTILSLDMRGFRKSLRAASKGVRNFSKDVAQPLGAATARMGKLLAIASGLAAIFGNFGMKAAGRMETLRLQLANLSSGAKDFKNQWEFAFDLFARSPLDLAPVIEATALLSAFGVKGEDNLRKVASAAVAMNRPMGDIVRAIGSMETESFRRLGVEVRKVGDDFTINFRDKAGNSMQAFASGIDAARKAAIDVLGIKFGGSLDLAAKTLEGAQSTFRGLRMLALAELFEGIRRRYVPALIKLNEKMWELAKSSAFRRVGEKAARNMEKVINIVRRVALAIHHLNQNSGGNLLKWAGIFAGVGLAFKSGLALPIIKASIMIGKWFVKGILMPFKSVIIAILAFLGGFSVAAALEESFDLSGVAKRMAAQTKAIASNMSNMLKNGFKVDRSDFDAEAARIAKTLEESLAKNKPKGTGDFWEKLGQNFEFMMKGAETFGNHILQGMIPEAARSALEMLKTLPDVVLPQMEAQMPNFGASVENGVRRGLSANKRRLVINGMDGRSGAQRKHDEIRNNMLKRMAEADKKHTALLQSLADRGAIVL